MPHGTRTLQTGCRATNDPLFLGKTTMQPLRQRERKRDRGITLLYPIAALSPSMGMGCKNAVSDVS